MFYDIVLFLVGLVLILAGSDYFTDGAGAIARRLHIPEIVIGLTIVAFGSSLPDLVVAVDSTLSNKAELALGDILGANIFDILLAIGIMALIAPVKPGIDMQRKQLPMLVLASLALFFVSDDILIDGTPDNIIDRSEGLLLLGFMVIFMKYTFSMTRGSMHVPSLSHLPAALDHPQVRANVQSAVQPSPTATEQERHPDPIKDFNEKIKNDLDKQPFIKRFRKITAPPKGNLKVWQIILCIAFGVGALIVGGNWLVDGASGIAARMGVSESLAGLTLVAVCSSVPDLSTSVIAALKKQSGLALGNIIGACILNVFFIIGLCATIKPMHINAISFVDYMTIIGGSLILYICGSLWKKHTITRAIGVVLCLLYVAYMAYLVIFQS